MVDKFTHDAAQQQYGDGAVDVGTTSVGCTWVEE